MATAKINHTYGAQLDGQLSILVADGSGLILTDRPCLLKITWHFDRSVAQALAGEAHLAIYAEALAHNFKTRLGSTIVVPLSREPAWLLPRCYTVTVKVPSHSLQPGPYLFRAWLTVRHDGHPLPINGLVESPVQHLYEWLPN